jgi:hypothetical protein
MTHNLPKLYWQHLKKTFFYYYHQHQGTNLQFLSLLQEQTDNSPERTHPHQVPVRALPQAPHSGHRQVTGLSYQFVMSSLGHTGSARVDGHAALSEFGR